MGLVPTSVLAALCALAPQARTVDAAELDELLLRYASDGWSGAALVARGGQVLLAQGYGFADFEADRPNTADTLFEIASVTKPFTATAVLQLAQARRLRLDDSIALHLPGVPAHSRKITLRHLLAHTSGIPRDHAAGSGDDLVPALLAYLGSGPSSRPGAAFEYWNGGYALLAGVVERASGRAYTQYLEEELFARAGMRATGFTGDADLDAAAAAIGCAANGPPRNALEHPYRSYGYQYRGMGGIVTSVRDLFAFDRALANGTLLDEAHARELFAPAASGYALGWYVGRSFDGGVRQSHGGSVRGFTADFRRLPEQDACIAVLANHDDARPYEIADGLECLLAGRALARPPPKVDGITDEAARAVAGEYASAAGKLVVRAAHGVLMAGVEGEALLEQLGGAGELGWKADRAALSRRAAEILAGLADGDTSTLRDAMAARIPRHWPDVMRRSVWPAHLAEHGDFRGVRPLGSRARDRLLEVLLALEHANGPARALVTFGPAGLERLDLSRAVPWFLASARLEPIRAGTFRLRLGSDPVKLEFATRTDPAASVRAAGLELTRN